MYNFKNFALILMMAGLAAISMLIILICLIAILCGKMNKTTEAWLIGAISSICLNGFLMFILNDTRVNYDDYWLWFFLVINSISITIAVVYFRWKKQRLALQTK